MDKSISEKITIISLISMVMVIYIHSYNIISLDGKLIFQPENTFSIFNIFLQNLISNGIARVAIPMFFIISGFLFFNNFSIKSYKRKVSKRFYTLFVPYIFWSFLAVLIYFILQLIPGMQHFFKNELLIDQTFFELFIITWVNPRNFPLWFLRDLMLLVILSPIIFYFVKNQTKLYFTIIIFLWFAITQPPAEISYFKAEPVFFFSLGAYISLLNNNILSIKIKNRKLLLLFIIYLILLFSKTTLITLYGTSYLFLHKLSVLLGIVLFWFLLDRYLMKNKHLLFLSKFTFLYYVFHEPGLMILQKGLYAFLGKTPLISMVSYVLFPIFMIFFLTILGIVMKKYIPKTTNVITGNRL